jgi:eukaryotic-like serine/threonine-protein kinase
MAGNTVCPECLAVLPADAPQGLCPACLMAAGRSVETVIVESDAAGPSTQLDEATRPPPATRPHDTPTVLHIPHFDTPTEPALATTIIEGTIRYFGDYELLTEIARGGMGVVYRARQISLNRLVALKMILAGQLAGKDEVRRFHLEAESAANLDHPGIVPIYEIGEHEGQHFFSMGFVEGTSLAARVVDGPLPPREAADLVRLVAEAIQYAHEKGVIHRDLKPANVLLDSQGRPKVTDFGLAKKLEGDSGLTHTGQVMGTPSYMPPEQADGKAVGPAADVYALGAILYCLLTGRPPFQAASPVDTLMQVVGQEPVPLRRLNASVKRDLEVICLKCLEKDPTRRYSSAAALGEDLRRFLNGEPISARPVGSVEKTWRWSKRNPLVASLVSVVALLMVAGTTTITGLWLRAERSRDEAVKAGRNADLSRQDAVAASKRAEANAATARRAVNDFLDRVTSSRQLQRPGLSGLRRDLLTQALTYYEVFLREPNADPELRAEVANAQNRAASILGEIGDASRAVEAGQRAVALYDQLIQDQPAEVKHREFLARSLISLANALRTTRRSDEAIAALKRSADLNQALLRDEPGNLDYATNLGVAWSNLSKILGSVGRAEESRALVPRLQAHLEDLVRRVPNASRPRNMLADIFHDKGNHASDHGDFETARGFYLRSLGMREVLVRENPESWEDLSQLARIENELGLLHSEFARPQEALTYLEKGRALRERLLAGEPESAILQEYLARSLENIGNLHNKLNKPADALPVLIRCAEIRTRLAAGAPSNAEMQSALGGSVHNLAMTRELLGEKAEAERLYREAMEHGRRALSIQPEVLVHRRFQTNHLISLADLLRGQGKIDEAARLAEAAADLWKREPQPLMTSALFLSACVESVGPGDSAEQKERRERFGSKAVSILNRAVDAGFRDRNFFQSSNQLDPIRGREDFKALLGRISTSSDTPK